MRWCGRDLAALAGVGVVLLAGCGHHKTTARTPSTQTAPPVYQPTYPSQPTQPAYPTTPSEPSVATGRIPITALPPSGVTAADQDFVLTHKPIFSEEGEATWYTAPYKGRKAANGQVFRDDALTAAHRTLPMGSLIVVTNLATRRQSAMRVSDRGPFVPDRVIDLTMLLRRQRAFTAWAPRVCALMCTRRRSRWIRADVGACRSARFTSEHKAEKFKQELLRKYPEARVIEFPGEDSYWVRIRPEGDNREEAESIARHLHPAQGDAYLTRLD